MRRTDLQPNGLHPGENGPLSHRNRIIRWAERSLAESLWQNIRCSILFHLLVPGGKWHTLIFSPSSSANSCRHTFHNRERLPLLPPESAVTSNSLASG